MNRARVLPVFAHVGWHEFQSHSCQVGCAAAWVERRPDVELPRLCIVGGTPPLTDVAIEKFLDSFLGEALMLGTPCTVLWDCQSGAFPSLKQFRMVIAWLDRSDDGSGGGQGGKLRAAVWDELVQGNAILLRNPLLRSVVRLMHSISRAPQPLYIGTDEDAALAFARDECRPIASSDGSGDVEVEEQSRLSESSITSDDTSTDAAMVGTAAEVGEVVEEAVGELTASAVHANPTVVAGDATRAAPEPEAQRVPGSRRRRLVGALKRLVGRG